MVSMSKSIVGKAEEVIIVFTIKDAIDLSDNQARQLIDIFESRLPGYKIVLVPDTITVQAFPLKPGMVYHREQLGQYEVEMVANSEHELITRREEMEKRHQLKAMMK